MPSAVPRILVVDDDKDLYNMVELAFSDENFRLTYARDGREALEKIGEEKPDVVVDIVDASNIERNLYLTTLLLELEAKSITMI